MALKKFRDYNNGCFKKNAQDIRGLRFAIVFFALVMQNTIKPLQFNMLLTN